ncbi:MAG: hypothetical protein IPN96_22485 [Anaerolineales bacterium]|nr:hypothetical protein [Anaerolineales bacterium]
MNQEQYQSKQRKRKIRNTFVISKIIEQTRLHPMDYKPYLPANQALGKNGGWGKKEIFSVQGDNNIGNKANLNYEDANQVETFSNKPILYGSLTPYL